MTRNEVKAARPKFWDARTGVFLLISGLLGWGEAANRSHIDEVSKARPSPIHYTGKWVPEKKVYHPGQIVRLAYVHGDEKNIPMNLATITVSSFRDEEHGIPYEATFYAGVATLGPNASTARVLPNMMQPSASVVVRGFVFCFGEDRTLPEPFCSESFAVTNWGSEQEKILGLREDTKSPNLEE